MYPTTSIIRGIYSHVNKKMGQEYTFYDKVQKLAKNAGVSVAQVERDLGIEQQAKKWRKFTPNASTLCKLADYFGVSVDFLLDREDSLSEQENALIALFRRLSESHRKDLIQIAESFAVSDAPAVIKAKAF